MKVKMHVSISGESSKIPTLYLSEKGVQIGEEREEGDYDSRTVYVAPVVAWESLAEFIDMLKEAQSLEVQVAPQNFTTVGKINKR